MQLFVDFVEPSGLYNAGREPCTIDPDMPVAVLTAAVFLEASGQHRRAAACRVYHVESGRFLDEELMGDAAVNELDTLVVVNTDVRRHHAPKSITMHWLVTGGIVRHEAFAGGVPLRVGTAAHHERAANYAN